MDNEKDLKRALQKLQLFRDMLDALGAHTNISLKERIVRVYQVLALIGHPLVGVKHIVLLLFSYNISPERRSLQCHEVTTLITPNLIPQNSFFVDGAFEKNVFKSTEKTIPIDALKKYGSFIETNNSFWKSRNIQLLIPLKTSERVLGFVGLGKDEGDFSDDDINFLCSYVEAVKLYLSGALSHEEVLKDTITRLYSEAQFIKEKNERFKEVGKGCSIESLSIILCEIENLEELIKENGILFRNNLLKELTHIFILFTEDPMVLTRYFQNKFLLILENLSFKETLFLIERLKRFIDTYTFSGKDGSLYVTSLFSFYRYSGKKKVFLDIINDIQKNLDRIRNSDNHKIAFAHYFEENE